MKWQQKDELLKVCWRMLAYAGVCERMLTYALVKRFCEVAAKRFSPRFKDFEASGNKGHRDGFLISNKIKIRSTSSNKRVDRFFTSFSIF